MGRRGNLSKCQLWNWYDDQTAWFLSHIDDHTSNTLTRNVRRRLEGSSVNDVTQFWTTFDHHRHAFYYKVQMSYHHKILEPLSLTPWRHLWTSPKISCGSTIKHRFKFTCCLSRSTSRLTLSTSKYQGLLTCWSGCWPAPADLVVYQVVNLEAILVVFF